MIKGDNTASLLSMRGITKEFSRRPSAGVDLDVVAGEVHCVLGQNGAGKSTLIKVLADAHQPDGGEIRWQGEPVQIDNPVAAIKMGIATMYQELDVVDGLTIAENIYLGHELATGACCIAARRPATRASCSTAATATSRRIARSAVGRQQADREHGRCALARRQAHHHGRAERRARLRGGQEPLPGRQGAHVPGIAIIYISHRLEEIRPDRRPDHRHQGRAGMAGLQVSGQPTPS